MTIKINKIQIKLTALTLFFPAVLFMFSGCGKETYSEARIAQELVDICRKEYKIEGVQVKAVGTTIGVYLPLKNLFSTNFKEVLAASKLKNLESLLQPSQEALDKVEDVLFTTSRVVLSTDKKVDFYVLQATDTETGLQLVLTGYVDDIKRVRLWDIPRSEYRKRVFHDLKIDRTAVWVKAVRKVLEAISKKPVDSILADSFVRGISDDAVSSFFYTSMLDGEHKKNITYDFQDVKSQVTQEGEGLLYLKLKENYESIRPNDSYPFLYPSGTTLEYIFTLRSSSASSQYRIAQVIPFYYLDDHKMLKRAQPKSEGELNEWQPLFDVEEVKLGDFLAGQSTRRIEGLLVTDERIFNTFSGVKVNVRYQSTEKSKKPFFALDFSLEPKDPSLHLAETNWLEQEDVTYLLDIVLREFVTVLRGYHFEDFSYFEIANTVSPSAAMLEKSSLELFRKGKITISGLLHPSIPAL